MSRIVVASISALLLFLPALVVFGDSGPVEASPAEAPAEPKPFPHREHVHADWMTKPEVKRDCRGCHDYDDSDGIREPEQSCKLCHYDFPDGKPALSVQGSIKGMRKEGSTFIHGDHLGLDCKACHMPPKGNRRGPRGVPNQMYIPEGLGWCVKCHDPAAPGAPSTDHAGFQKAINQNPTMRANPNAVFRHSEHLSDAEINDPQSCAMCHSSIEKAEAQIGENVYNASSCGDCHVSEAGKSLPFGIQTRKFVSGSDLSFYHSDHMTKEAMANSPSISKNGCFACHDQIKEEGRAISDYPLKRGFDKYEQCAKCHQDEGVKWQGQDGKADPMPVTWRIEDHADMSDKNTCTKCHVIGEAVSMRTTRPERELERSRPSLFEITVQAHPHITGPNDTKNKDCKSCHIAEADLIPSRIKKKKFRHAAHLSKNADDAQCMTCHMLSGNESPSYMQMAGHGDLKLSYSEQSCNECHKGIELVKAGAYTRKLPKMIAFDHNDHIKEMANGLKCADCHTGTGSGDREFGFADGVMDCSKCHDHNEHYKNTGNKDQGYVNGCVACHEVHEPGVPAIDSVLEAARVDIHSIDGPQFHPLPTEKRCTECHRPGFTREGGALSTINLILSERTYERPKDFHGGHEKQGEVTPKYCFACHWNDFGRLKLSSVTRAVIEGEPTEIKGQPYSQTENVDGIRQRLGNQMRNYPGIVK